MTETFIDILSIKRVANGWVLLPGCHGPDEFTHVAATPDDVAEYVRSWTLAQLTPPLSRRIGS